MTKEKNLKTGKLNEDNYNSCLRVTRGGLKGGSKGDGEKGSDRDDA